MRKKRRRRRRGFFSGQSIDVGIASLSFYRYSRMANLAGTVLYSGSEMPAPTGNFPENVQRNTMGVS